MRKAFTFRCLSIVCCIGWRRVWLGWFVVIWHFWWVGVGIDNLRPNHSIGLSSVICLVKACIIEADARWMHTAQCVEMPHIWSSHRANVQWNNAILWTICGNFFGLRMHMKILYQRGFLLHVTPGHILPFFLSQLHVSTSLNEFYYWSDVTGLRCNWIAMFDDSGFWTFVFF